VTQADCNARHLRIFACWHALVATMQVEAGAAVSVTVRRRPAQERPPTFGVRRGPLSKAQPSAVALP